MDLQNTFYLVGIIFMSLAIIILIFIGYVLFSIKQAANKLSHTVEEKLDTVGRIMNDPTDAAIQLGSQVAEKAVKKVKSMISK